MQFVPGELLVRFKDELNISVFKSNGKAQTGIASTDALFSEFGVLEAIKLIPNAQPLPQKQILRAPTGRDFERPSLHNIYHLKVSTQDYRMFELIEALKEDKNILYAEPNYIYNLTDHEALSPALTAEDLAAMYPSQQPPDNDLKSGKAVIVPNDPLYGQQWWIGAIQANLAWETSTGDANQVIAVLDTGVDWQHPDLVNKIWTNPNETINGSDSDGNGFADDIRGWDFINNDNNPMDDNSHGTHVAGIAAAEANNGIGIAGVSWGARIMPVKILQSSGSGNAATIAQGINYAANNGATVINMSFGSYARSLAMEDALANAYATSVLVAAAGNDGNRIGPIMGAPMFPAALSFVLGIEATEPSGERAGWSNYDQDGAAFSGFSELFNYELKAPGTTLLSTIPGGSYRSYSGTSMAAPIASGTISILQPLFPGLSQEYFWPKLIHSVDPHINLLKALTMDPLPYIQIISHQLNDSIGGNGNGSVDAGETIRVSFKARNVGGHCDSTYAMIRFAEFEDTLTANIISPVAYFGSISPYATRVSTNPIIFHINPTVAHDRIISFELLAWWKGSNDTLITPYYLNVTNGEILTGIMDSTLILTKDKLWIVDNGMRIGLSGHLIIEPGTKLIIRNSSSYFSGIVVRGKVTAIGTPENQITIIGQNIAPGWSTGAGFTHQYGQQESTFSYCNFSNFSPLFAAFASYNSFSFVNISNSTIYDAPSNNASGGGVINPIKTFVDNFVTGGVDYGSLINMRNTYFWPYKMYLGSTNSPWPISANNLYNNYISFDLGYLTTPPNIDYSSFNNLINCKLRLSSHFTGDLMHLPNLYWGTGNNNKIEKIVGNIPFNPLNGMIVFEPKLTIPNDIAHAIVWKVLVNGADAQDEYVEPVGVGQQRFDVYFNRPMDIAFTPMLTFGVRAPYTQQAVNENDSWSADSTIYTAYKTIHLYTGDGFNRIRVAGARDTGGFEIPIEDQRFEFLIDAAGSASTDFIATPGMGKVELEWSHPEAVEDLLGYNLYRFKHLTDTTFTNPILLNSTLVLDTLYTDFEVLPGTKYYYYYKILRTNLVETDSSRVVNGIPHTAALGDANGDYNVNILDITSLVSFILNGNPQPFIFEAADVNADGQINLLDVIGVVNIIMNVKKSTVLSKPATVYLNTEQAEIKSDGTLAGLQFQLIGKNIEQLELKNLPKGFEFIRMINGDTLTGILFNMQNNTLPEGRISLFDIAQHPGTLEWGKVFGGNYLGKYIPVFTSEDALPVDHRYSFNVYPNPAMEHFISDIQLPSKSEVQLQIFDMYGRSIKLMNKAIIDSGRHQFRFDKQQLPPAKGLYILQVKIRPLDKNELPYRKEVKIMFL